MYKAYSLTVKPFSCPWHCEAIVHYCLQDMPGGKIFLCEHLECNHSNGSTACSTCFSKYFSAATRTDLTLDMFRQIFG